MIWCSGWQLAAAVSNAGGLGLIGAGSMYPDVLRTHIQKCKNATNKPFGVNVPLIYPQVEQLMQIIVDENVPIVFTSAGNPKTWTNYLKSKGIKVAHVIANVKFAQKCAEAGVDAIVAEGFEAGGHNGREETTTLVLTPLIRKAVTTPIIAAGGIATGEAMFAAMALGAEGVQIGSRFAASVESAAHPNFKEKIINTADGDTYLTLKQLVAVRLIKNKFFFEVEKLQHLGADAAQLSELLGKGRAKRGMFEGDIDEGELEIGQVAALIDQILPAQTIVENLIAEFRAVQKKMAEISI